MNFKLLPVFKCMLLLFLSANSLEVLSAIEDEKDREALELCSVTKSDQKVLDELDFKINVEDFLKHSKDCSNTYLTQILQVFVKLKNIEFKNIPAGIDNEITRALANPYVFLKQKYFTEFSFKPSGRVVASFDINNSRIYLSNYFFEVSLAEQISTLIHEAQHSDVKAPWHESCYKGQLMGRSGGCDGVLETKLSLVGSYSVEYWFLKLVAEVEHSYFSEDEKRTAFLRTNELIAHRFNHALDHSKVNDIILVLSEDNKLFIYDPISKKHIEKLPQLWGNIEKIKQNTKNDGFYIITKDNKLLSWNPDTQLLDGLNYDSLGSFQGKIKDIFRIIHPEYKINRNILVGIDGEFYLEGINKKLEKDYLLYEEPNFLQQFVINQYDQVILRPNNKVEILDSNFEISDLEQKSAPEVIENIAPSQYGYYFYSLSQEGVVYFSKVERESGYSTMSRVATGLIFKEDELQSRPGTKSIKITEGTSIRGLLNNQGELVIARHEKNIKFSVIDKEPEKKLISNSLKVKDFTLIKVTTQQGRERFYQPRINLFKEKCNILEVQLDPWLNRPMGINKKNELILLGSGGCVEIMKGVNSFSFPGKGIQNNPYGYDVSQLNVLLLDGSLKEISAY